MAKEITTRPQKILLVITKSNWGGAQKYVYDVATELASRGYDIQVAAGGQGEMVTRLRDKDIRVHDLGKLKNNMNLFSSVHAFFELVSLYKNIRPDVVHLNSSKVGLLGAIAGRITGVPHIIFTAHGWPFNEDRPVWQTSLLRFLMWLTILCTHRTICVSKKTCGDLRAPSFIMKKCTVVHNGIHPLHFKAPTAFYEERHVMRKEKITLVSIGELHPSKGFDLALSYVKDLQDLSWEWFILGEGGERARLDKMIREHHLTSRVHLIGHTKDAAEYLQAFDIFFLPSRTEALAYVALEAIQSNLPIIASDVGGIPEVLGNDRGTILINIRDKDTPTTLRTILESPVQKIDSTLRENLRKEFSLEKMIGETLKVYNQE